MFSYWWDDSSNLDKRDPVGFLPQGHALTLPPPLTLLHLCGVVLRKCSSLLLLLEDFSELPPHLQREWSLIHSKLHLTNPSNSLCTHSMVHKQRQTTKLLPSWTTPSHLQWSWVFQCHMAGGSRWVRTEAQVEDPSDEQNAVEQSLLVPELLELNGPTLLLMYYFLCGHFHRHLVGI